MKADDLQRMIQMGHQADSYVHGIMQMIKYREVGMEGAIESARNYVEHQMAANPCADDCTNDCEAFNREAFEVAEERVRSMIEAGRRLVANADRPKALIPIEEMVAEAAEQEAEERQQPQMVAVDPRMFAAMQAQAEPEPEDDVPTGFYL